ncbi:signal transduction histidine kinase [Pseudonocardia hierapolitana]|uniref:histidine kinase n=1 Tax=Pseudonocardia hierapolitana TaxID=1128676 RepID=A0A561SKP1_9PSEU|nr:histidine kinase [Pseudonocardia hierapolitana]TWF75413.1 signal transduction histidine kinase [Pseudonocardia hierapolitana]
MRTWARTGSGLVLGACTAAVHLLLALPVAAALLVPALRPVAESVVCRLAGLERRRIVVLLGGTGGRAEPPPARALRYLATRIPVGLLGGAVLTLLGIGLTFAATLLFSWVTQTPWVMEREAAVVVSGLLVAYYAVPGAVLLYLALAGAGGVARWERTLLGRLLAPSREEQLTRRVEELSRTRDAIVAAVDDERRRIERDLHDGVQQRLVALGMLLGRARRHPDRAAELVAQAHDEAQRTLVELRDVSWRVYPAALDTGGLAAALESVAERAPLPVRIHCDLPVEPPATVRAAAWFVISEAVTNAAKHSGALRVDVEVAMVDGRLRATVRDDGRGGADPAAGGLAGLARRVAAADGAFTVDSPAGGPTVVTAELPCA